VVCVPRHLFWLNTLPRIMPFVSPGAIGEVEEEYRATLYLREFRIAERDGGMVLFIRPVCFFEHAGRILVRFL
jgi:hypothetical protein